MTNRIRIIRITKHCQRNMWLQIYLTVTKSTICLQNILRLGLFGGPRKSLTATKFNNLTSLHFHISFFFVSVASVGFPAGIILPRPPTCAALRFPPQFHIVFFISTCFSCFFLNFLWFFFFFGVSVAPEESKYMGNRMMERGYFATVFPDEGCLANPRWRMSCKWCQIVKFSCCATFPWPSQNSKTFLLHFDLFHLTSKTFLFLRFDLYLVVPFNLCYLHIVLSMV